MSESEAVERLPKSLLDAYPTSGDLWILQDNRPSRWERQEAMLPYLPIEPYFWPYP